MNCPRASWHTCCPINLQCSCDEILTPSGNVTVTCSRACWDTEQLSLSYGPWELTCTSRLTQMCGKRGLAPPGSKRSLPIWGKWSVLSNCSWVKWRGKGNIPSLCLEADGQMPTLSHCLLHSANLQHLHLTHWPGKGHAVNSMAICTTDLDKAWVRIACRAQRSLPPGSTADAYLSFSLSLSAQGVTLFHLLMNSHPV